MQANHLRVKTQTFNSVASYSISPIKLISEYMCECEDSWTNEGEDETSSCRAAVCPQTVNGAPVQCQNDGTCSETGGNADNGWHFCDCATGFTGPFCDIG